MGEEPSVFLKGYLYNPWVLFTALFVFSYPLPFEFFFVWVRLEAPYAIFTPRGASLFLALLIIAVILHVILLAIIGRKLARSFGEKKWRGGVIAFTAISFGIVFFVISVIYDMGPLANLFNFGTAKPSTYILDAYDRVKESPKAGH
jgi:hypothetical protein